MKPLEFLMSYAAFARYLLVGFSAFAIDYGALIFLYYVLNLSLSVSTTTGYLLGLMVSFLINRLWVFGQEGQARNPLRQIIEYVVLVIFNYLFTLWAITVLEDAGVEPFIGKVITMGFIVMWNYLLFSKVIFAKKTS